MSKRPQNVSWLGFTTEQADLLEFLDHVGNNGWARNSQTEALIPKLLKELHDLGVPIERVKQAMASIGYERAALHELDRWESKRTTGKFGR
jgi:hypothetical protein